MKIAIDISQTAHEGSGVARYTETLIRSLLEYDKINTYTFFYSSLRKKPPCSVLDLIKEKTILKVFPFPPSLLSFLWNTLHIFSIDFLIGKHDILITSDWTEPPSSAKKITILHDLIIFKFPETFKNSSSFNATSLTLSPNIIKTHKTRLQHVKQESKAIVCDSYSTKKDAEEILDIADNKLKVIYPAVETFLPSAENREKTLQKYDLKKPFILSVGKIEPRKNIKRLIEAYNSLNLKNIPLVVVGKLGWEEKSIIESNKNIIFTGFVTDTELYSLYHEALFFVYPSLYEGFGLPIIEAMSLGCPTTVSNTSSMNEIGKDSSFLFNPLETSSIANALKTMINDAKKREDIKKKGMTRAQDFREKQFAESFISLFNTL